MTSASQVFVGMTKIFLEWFKTSLQSISTQHIRREREKKDIYETTNGQGPVLQEHVLKWLSITGNELSPVRVVWRKKYHIKLLSSRTTPNQTESVSVREHLEAFAAGFHFQLFPLYDCITFYIERSQFKWIYAVFYIRQIRETTMIK